MCDCTWWWTALNCSGHSVCLRTIPALTFFKFKLNFEINTRCIFFCLQDKKSGMFVGRGQITQSALCFCLQRRGDLPLSHVTARGGGAERSGGSQTLQWSHCDSPRSACHSASVSAPLPAPLPVAPRFLWRESAALLWLAVQSVVSCECCIASGCDWRWQRLNIKEELNGKLYLMRALHYLWNFRVLPLRLLNFADVYQLWPSVYIHCYSYICIYNYYHELPLLCKPNHRSQLNPAFSSFGSFVRWSYDRPLFSSDTKKYQLFKYKCLLFKNL